MGLIKKISVAPPTTEMADPANSVIVTDGTSKELAKARESGTAAAIARLQTAPGQAATAPKYAKPRDFDQEARGKTKCVQFEAALMSPAIAGMAFKTMAEYLALVKEAADAGVKYTFGE
jgi:hypothetical protein